MGDTNQRLVRFCAIAFGYTWLLAGLGWLSGINADSGLGYLALAAFCMLGPAIAAIICQRHFDRRTWSGLGLRIAGTNGRILVGTIAVGLSLSPLYLLVQHFFGDVLGIALFGHAEVSTARLASALLELSAQFGASPADALKNAWLLEIPAWLLLIGVQVVAVLSAFSLNLVFMLGEELGWRGYLYQELQAWSTLRRIGVTGVLWGLWHAPLIAMGHNYPGYPVIGIGMMVLFCLLASFIFDWSRARSASIWSSAVLHGIINGSAGGAVLFAWGGHPLVGSVVGLAGFMVLALVILAILMLDGSYRRSLLGKVAAI